MMVFAGISTSLSIMVLRIFAYLPTFTFSNKMDSSTSEKLFTLTFGERMERFSLPPLIMHPCETSESVAMPTRFDFSSAKTNFDGGCDCTAVLIGHSSLYRLKIGVTLIKSIEACQ